jgi:small-conductance mechanosensitive channel
MFLTIVDDLAVVFCTVIVSFLISRYTNRAYLRTPIDYILDFFNIHFGDEKLAIFRYLVETIFQYLVSWFCLVAIGIVFSILNIEYSNLIIVSSVVVMLAMVLKILGYFVKSRVIVLFGFIIIAASMLQNLDKNNTIFTYLEKVVINLIVIKFSIRQLISAIYNAFSVYCALAIWDKLSKFVITKKISDINDRAIYTRICKYLAVTIGGIYLLRLSGVSSANLTVLTGSLGIGIGFALQKVASNFISGIILMIEKKIRVGDLVFLPNFHNETGYIKQIDIRSTIIENFQGEKLIIPNEYLSNEILKNLTLYSRFSREAVCFIVDFNVDLQQVVDIALSIAKNNPYCSKNNQPSCRVLEVTPVGYKVSLRFWVDDIDSNNQDAKDIWSLKSDIMIELQKVFRREGIKFAPSTIVEQIK